MAHEVRDQLPFAIGGSASMGVKIAGPLGDGSTVSQIPGSALNYGLFDRDGTANTGTGGVPYPRFRPDLAGRIVTHPNKYNGTPPDLSPVKRRCVQLSTSFIGFAGGATFSAAVVTGAGAQALPSATTSITVGPGSTSGQTSPAAITSYNRGAGVKFDTTHGRYGAVALLSTSTAAARVKPIDDQMAVTAQAGDWIYVVEEGPCTVPLVSSSSTAVTNITAGQELCGGRAVQVNTSGAVAGGWMAAAQGDVVSAIALTSATIAQSSDAHCAVGSVLAYVLPGLDTTQTYG